MTSPKVFDSEETYTCFEDDIDSGTSCIISTPKEKELGSQHLPFKKKKYICTTNFNYTGNQEFENKENTNLNKETVNKLKQILEKQNGLEARMSHLEIAFHDKIVDKNEFMAQNKVLRECKVIMKKVQHSLGRITGEIKDETFLELAAIFPLAMMDAAFDFEEKLQNTEFATSVKTYIYQLKGKSNDLEGMLKLLMTDDLLLYFNWSGTWGKKALMKMKLFNEILYDVFNIEGRCNFEAGVKRYIEKSHNRIKQKQYQEKKKLHISDPTL